MNRNLSLFGLAGVGVTSLFLGACGAGDDDIDEAELDPTEVSQDALVASTCIAPPALSNPVVVEGVCPETIDARGRDLLVRMPARTCRNPVSIRNARHVRWIGGDIEFPSSTAVGAISLSSITGTAHIEGLHVDVNNRAADAIRIYRSPGAVLTVQNTLIEGPGGVPSGPHGDLIHTQGGGPLAELRVENFTGYTSYQGIFTPYRLPEDGSTGAERIVMKNVDVAYDPRMPSSQKPLMLLVFGSGNPKPNRYGDRDFTAPKGTSLTNVFVDASARNLTYYSRVMVQPKPAGSCATFDPVHKITGKVCDGRGRADFAPRSAVGLNYARSKFCTN